MTELQKEIALILDELGKIPPFPWKLKRHKKSLLILDKFNEEVAVVNDSIDNYLILANFLNYAPERFEKLIKALANKN